MSDDRIPPHDEAIEAAALGCILQCSDCKPTDLTLGDFYATHHRIIYLAALSIFKDGMAVDAVTVFQRLRASGESEQVGGVSVFAKLTGVPASFDSYAKTLQGLRQRRALLEIAGRISIQAHDPKAAIETIPQDIESVLASVRSLTGSNDLPEIIDISHPLPADEADPEEIILGVLHRGSKMVIGGCSKSFKTWSLLDLAISVSHGEPWWSFKTRKGRVLYLNFEIQGRFFKRRADAVASAKAIKLSSGALDAWNLRGYSCDPSVLLPKIARAVKDTSYVLVVIDPVYKLLNGRDENSAGDIGALMNAIERLALDTGSAVVFGAHFSKGNQAGKESIDRISGSGVFARDPDSIIAMTKHAQENAFTVDGTLRNFKPVQPFCVRWDFPLMRRDDGLDPKALKQAHGGRPPSYSEDEILQTLGSRKLTTAEWFTRAKDATGVSRGKFFEIRATLERNEKIIKANGEKWMRNIPSPESPITP